MTEELLTERQAERHPEVVRARVVWWAVIVWACMVAALFVGFLITHDRGREQDRMTARYVLCLELEAIKRAERASISERIRDNEIFLLSNPEGLPELRIYSDNIVRIIDRDRLLLQRLHPYPGGCVKFARDPSGRNTKVPPLPKE